MLRPLLGLAAAAAAAPPYLRDDIPVGLRYAQKYFSSGDGAGAVRPARLLKQPRAENATCSGVPPSQLQYIADGKCHDSNGLKYQATCNENGTIEFQVFLPTSNTCDQPQGPAAAIPSNVCLPDEEQSGSNFTFTCTGTNVTQLIWEPPETPLNETDLRITMRDGAVLYTRIFFPDCMGPNDKLAFVYQQVPYSVDYHKRMVIASWQLLLSLPACTVLALQETRSRYNSTGDFDFFRLSKADASDTVSHLFAQPWSNQVCLPWGISAMGIKSVLAAGADPHVVIRAQSTGIAAHSFRSPTMIRGGALNSGILASMIPFTGIDISEVGPALVAHEGPGTWWDGADFTDWGAVSWPTVHWTAWWDILQQSALDTYEGYDKDATCAKLFSCTNRLVVDPLGHCGLYGIPKDIIPMNATAIEFTTGMYFILTGILFKFLKDATNDVTAAGLNTVFSTLMKFVPRKVFYVMGSGGNFVAGVDEWPKHTPTDMYLAADRLLLPAAAPAGNLTYTYDPSNPAPTRGGYLFSGNEVIGCGPVDQAPVSAGRTDVPTWTASKLSSPLAITGRITATLSVASSANDTDFIARLVDVFPTGERYLVAEGIQRMRWRGGATAPVAMEPGVPVSVSIDMWSTSWIFAAGHSVGVDVTSSSSYMYLPNPNTGLPLRADSLWPEGGFYYKGENVTAQNTIVFGASKVTLPVVNAADLTPYDHINIPFVPIPPPPVAG